MTISSPAVILLLPFFSAVLILLVLKRSAGVSALVATGSALLTLVLSIGVLMKGGAAESAVLYNWSQAGGLSLDIALKNDALSRGMMIVVTGIGTLVHIFSLAYMKDDAGKARFFAGLSLFMFSMTGIVYADNFPMMFIFWELVGVSSYLLIGHWYTKASAADAAKKAFLTNRIGDFGFMIGILLLWSMTGALTFDGMKEKVDAMQVAGLSAAQISSLTIATLLVFCGTVGKSAQFPLHVWLPDAMEGPTPVSALIHAATMVAAGVYMMVRVSFLVGVSHAGEVISWIGGVTALLAALMATQQNDIKRILAYSTLSQLGYMVMAVGLGASEASMFHLFTHAWFKAGLFLGSGAVIYACHHEQDIWKMGGLSKKMPVTFATFAACTAALVAVPFVTSGWYSKEAILEAAKEKGGVLFVLAAFTALLTAFYMTRLVVVAFLGKARDEHGAGHAHEVAPVMFVPLVILAVMGLIGGFGAVAGAILGHEQLPAHGHFGVVGMVSIATLIIGAGGAFVLYRGRDQDPVNIKLFANKFYFDELYAKVIAVAQDGLATVVKVLDGLLIDGLGVRGAAGLASGAGGMLRRLQVGNIQGYAFLFGLGVLLLVFLALAK
jgi:NADH-quinone oxidoreductase subunit L